MKRSVSVLNFYSYAQCSLSLALNHFLGLIPFTLTYIFLEGAKNQLYVPVVSLTDSFYMLSFGYLPGFEDAIALRCSIPITQGDFKKAAVRFWKLVLINIALLSLSVIMTMRCESIIVVLELPHGLTEFIALFCKYLLIAKIIENFSNMGKGLLIAQRIYWPFIYINFVTLVVFAICDWLFIERLGFHVYGFLIAYYVKVVLELSMVCYVIMKYSHTELFVLPNFSEVVSDIIGEFKNTSCIIFSVYGEFIADEINTVLAARTGNIAFVYTWTVFLNIWAYVYFIMLGLAGSMRTFASYAIGTMGDVRTIMTQCGIYSAIFIGVISFVLATFSENLARVFSSDPDVYLNLAICLRIYALVIFFECSFVNLSMAVKLMNKADIQFMISTVMYPVCSIVFGYLICYGLNMGVVGLEVAFLMTNVTCVSSLLWVVRSQFPVFEQRLRDNDLDGIKSTFEESLIEFEMSLNTSRKRFIMNTSVKEE